jgi:hypothetical protein
MTTPDELAADLVVARDAFLGQLDRVEPGSLSTPGLVGSWSGRELVAHLGYWAGHATEIIHAVETGREDETGVAEPPTDEVNATVARIARETPMATVRKREAASVEALLERLRALDPGLLEVRLADGGNLAQAVRADGADHYREHAAAIREALDGGARG